MLDLDAIDVEEIATALADQTDYEHRWLIDPRTGEVAFWTSDTGIDGENPVELDELDRSLQGKGAFRRFKNELYQRHPELISVWHAFRDARARSRVVRWLADEGLIDEDASSERSSAPTCRSEGPRLPRGSPHRRPSAHPDCGR